MYSLNNSINFFELQVALAKWWPSASLHGTRSTQESFERTFKFRTYVTSRDFRVELEMLSPIEFLKNLGNELWVRCNFFSENWSWWVIFWLDEDNFSWRREKV